jgi:hypothetical protein
MVAPSKSIDNTNVYKKVVGLQPFHEKQQTPTTNVRGNSTSFSRISMRYDSISLRYAAISWRYAYFLSSKPFHKKLRTRVYLIKGEFLVVWMVLCNFAVDNRKKEAENEEIHG